MHLRDKILTPQRDILGGPREICQVERTPCEKKPQDGLLQSRAEYNAKDMHDTRALIDKYVGFIDFSKIRMARPDENGRLQRGWYSGNKRMYCLIYKKTITPDGLILSQYVSEVGNRHEMTLLRSSGLEQTLQHILVIEGSHYYIYSAEAYFRRPGL